MAFPENERNRALACRLSLNELGDCLRFPKYFEIETINACNARCIMCSVADWEKGGAVTMSGELFEKFVRETARHDDWVEVVCLARDGEPLLDRALVDRVRLLKEAGVKKVTFSTNGQLLEARRVNELIDVGLDDVMVSIDGATKGTFESVRRGLDYDVVLENALGLIRVRDERGSRMTIRIRMVVLEENRHEVGDWMEFWRSKAGRRDRVYAKKVHTWGNQAGRESADDVARYADVPCISPFSTMVIKADGRVPLCGCDYKVTHVMGDVSRQSIEEIWKGERYEELRRCHAFGDRNRFDMCRGCHIWDDECVITDAVDL